MQEKVALAKKLLAKLRFLAQEVMPCHPFPLPKIPFSLSFPESLGRGNLIFILWTDVRLWDLLL